jgi:hypothetical protein
VHWLDSLAALGPPAGTAGKTIRAHRLAFQNSGGSLGPREKELLLAYRDARVRFARGRPDDTDALTVALLDAADLDSAIERARRLLDAESAPGFEAALRYFSRSYERIWSGGEIPRQFLEAVREPIRGELAAFLVHVARFMRVSPSSTPPPRVVLAPVESGFGTHAQAIDRYLLVEIRRGESLEQQIAPIVHENAHFLFYRIEPDRLGALRRAALEAGARGEQAWELLREALPTAIAQGVADSRFRRVAWSRDAPWYHVEAIDDYAKRIFPRVRQALVAEQVLDEALVRELVALLPSTQPQRRPDAVTPRSP